ncbi:MAG TPA: hypothetical protein VF297_28490 [Pyrinomonadaceae bacterium]
MKKAYISPVTPLLVSLSLALGILVGDVGGYKLLTSAHAQAGGNCGGTVGGEPIVSDTVFVEDALILNSITVHNVTVNGTFVEQAVVVGGVQLVNTTVAGSSSIYSDSDAVASGNGVLIGSGSPCTTGVLIGSGSPVPTGVLIGSGSPTQGGVLIGSDAPTQGGVLIGSGSPVVSGVTGEATGTTDGGTLTGEDISITDGFITGRNLLLSGATIDQGSISGIITSIRITPAN